MQASNDHADDDYYFGKPIITVHGKVEAVTKNNPLKVAHYLAKKSLETRADIITEGLEQYLIPVAIAQKVVDHAIKFQCDHPRWKPEKAVRKTVEYFQLKKKGSK